MITDDLKSLEELNVKGNYLQDDALAYFVECFYKLERKWMAKPREIDNDIMHIDPKLAEYYQLAHKTLGNERVTVIIELIEYLSKKYKVPFDGEIIQYRD